jgi:RecB family exonuclease
MNLSHSQIETWQQCELKWAHGKVYNSPRGPSPALILGTAFHGGIEESLRNLNPPSFDACLNYAQTLLQMELQRVDPDGLVTEEQRDNMTRRLTAMLTAFYEQIRPNIHPVGVEIDFTYRVGDHQFRGRIDCITPTAILDWKTASRPWEHDAQHEKDQATAYLIARPDATKVTFVVFTCTEADPDVCIVRTHPTTRTEEQKAEYRQRVEQIATNMAEAAKHQTFTARVGPLCGWCEFLGSCAIGRQWLADAKRQPRVPMVGEVRALTYAEVTE